MNNPQYHLLPGFLHRRRIWHRQAVANGQETLARVLLDNIVRTEKLLKDYKPENEFTQLELW